MVKRMLAFALAVVVALALGTPNTGAFQKKPTVEERKGMVVSVDAKNHKVTLKVSDFGGFRAPTQFNVAKDVRITLADGKAGKLSDLKEGDYVTFRRGSVKGRPIYRMSVHKAPKKDK